MSCNSCAKPYTFLRKEKSCPHCGFGYCSKCLDHQIFVPKLNAEAKVCLKCKRSLETNEQKKVEPPDAYYKRLGVYSSNSTSSNQQHQSIQRPIEQSNTMDQEILNRLQKLKEGKETQPVSSEDEIASRLHKIKGETPKTSDAGLHERLANLRGVPISAVQSKPFVFQPDTRTEQEQANDLMKQYLDQANIDNTYKDEFEGLVNNIEARINKLKGTSGPSGSTTTNSRPLLDSEDEEDAVKIFVEKMKAESCLENDDLEQSTHDELPFCEICNEDAKMRCLGCKYLFCKRCFLDHKDDDDGCDRYESYTPPKKADY